MLKSKLKILLVVLVVCGTFNVYSAEPDQLSQAHAAKQTPLRQATPKKSSLKSIDDAIIEIDVTNYFPTSYPNRVKTNADVGKLDAEKWNDFVLGAEYFSDLKKIPNKDKKIYNSHYEMGDPRMTDATLAALAAGVGKIAYLIDFNVALKLGPNDSTTSDFRKLVEAGQFADNAEGRELKRLLDESKGKFKVFGHDNLYSKVKDTPEGAYAIASQPLIAKKGGFSEAPIYHEKAWALAYTDPKTGELVPVMGMQGEINYTLADNAVIDKAGNASHQSRFNISFIIVDPDYVANMIEHAEATLDAFGDGGTIADIKAIEPIEMQYEDGFIRNYYTHGNENPHQATVDLFREAIATIKKAKGIPLRPKDPPNGRNVKITRIDLRHFVFTYRDYLDALIELLSLDPDIEMLNLFDNQFDAITGFGFSPLFGGFILDRMLGGPVQDYKGILSGNPKIITYIYQRMIQGLMQTDPSAAPRQVYLNHGKGDVIDANIDGKVVTVMGNGSENLSGHVASSESHSYAEISPESETAKAMHEILPKVIEIEKAKGYVVPVELATTRNVLGEFTGHVFIEIPLDQVQNIVDMVTQASRSTKPAEIRKLYGQVSDLIFSISHIPTQNRFKVSDAELKSRMDALSKLIDVVSTWPVIGKEGNGFIIQRFVAVAINLFHKNESDVAKLGDLKFFVWREGIDPKEYQRRVNQVAETLGLTVRMTDLKPPGPPDAPVKPTKPTKPPTKPKALVSTPETCVNLLQNPEAQY